MSGTPDVPRPSLAELRGPFVPVAAMGALMWVEELLDLVLGGRLDRYGIRPRRLDGLDGVVLSPFLHSGFAHLVANTIPFLVLGAAVAFSGMRRFLEVTVIVALVGGLGTWLTGPSGTVHIGASGLVFGYLLYLLARGVIARNLLYLVVGAVVFLAYGSVLWGLLPAPGVSWQGHVFGAVGGVVAAKVLHDRKRPEPVTAAA